MDFHIRHIGVAAAALLCAAVVRGAEVPISVDDAVRSAVAHNLDLRVESFNPALSETAVRRARAIYDPRVTALLDHREEAAPAFPSSSFTERSRFFDADVAVSALLPSGATASAAFTNLLGRDNLEGPLSRFARPELALTLSQPVLSGLGREVTGRGITTASDAKESALAAWRVRAIEVAAGVRDRYFALIKARDDLDTRKASLAVARQVHAENQARVKAGVLAEIELLDSGLGVAQREKDLIEAEKNALDQADRLRVLIQYPAGSSLVPSEPFPEGPSGVSAEEATAAALGLRPDLAGARIDLRTREFLSRVNRNLALPSVSLDGSVGVSGLGRDYGSALDDLGAGKYPSWSVGVSFAYPLGNDAAEADLAAARLQARQAQAALRSLEESIGLDVRTAVRDLDSKRRQVEVAQKGVTLSEARLASYLKRQKLGLAPTKDLFQVESDLVAARVGLSAARADYQGAATLLYRSTGELLERHGIRVDDRAVENAAWKELR